MSGVCVDCLPGSGAPPTVEIVNDDVAEPSQETAPKDSQATIKAKSQIATLSAMIATLTDKTDDYVIAMEKELRAKVKQLSIQIKKGKDLPQQIITLTKAKGRRHTILVEAQQALKEAHETLQEAQEEFEIVASELQSVQDQQQAEEMDRAASKAMTATPVLVTPEHLQAITVVAASAMPQQAVALQEMLQHVAKHLQPDTPQQHPLHHLQQRRACEAHQHQQQQQAAGGSAPPGDCAFLQT